VSAIRLSGPSPTTVADHSQGVQLAAIQALARRWATDYDWRRCERDLGRVGSRWPNCLIHTP
jgi:hypothetical protein